MAVSGLRLPGLRENALIPDSATPVFPVGSELESLKGLYESMYRYLQENIPGCETACHYLMLALLSRVLQIIGATPHPDQARAFGTRNPGTARLAITSEATWPAFRLRRSVQRNGVHTPRPLSDRWYFRPLQDPHGTGTGCSNGPPCPRDLSRLLPP